MHDPCGDQDVGRSITLPWTIATLTRMPGAFDSAFCFATVGFSHARCPAIACGGIAVSHRFQTSTRESETKLLRPPSLIIGSTADVADVTILPLTSHAAG